MKFETEEDVLNWYQGEKRIITTDFLSQILWEDVKKYPIDSSFIPVILYMRDIELFTEVYYQQLLRSPTGKDRHIRKFMDRWVEEEPVHAELLNRFLEEFGIVPEDKWQQKAKKRIPMNYHIISRVQSLLTGCFGKAFSAVHMTWGAINEYSTMTGYNRLMELANHPVLRFILKGIIKEEGRHSFFYWNVAKIKLERSSFRRTLSRFIVDRFWAPVGSGAKPEKETNLVIKTLFNGEEGVSLMDQMVNKKIAELPGFDSLMTITNRVAAISF